MSEAFKWLFLFLICWFPIRMIVDAYDTARSTDAERTHGETR